MKQQILLATIFVLLLSSLVAAQSIQVTTISCPGGTFETTNDSIKCVTCQTGFTPINGTCTQNAKNINTQASGNSIVNKFNKFIDENGAQIFPTNPSIGRILLLILTIVLFYYVFVAIKKTMRAKGQ